MTMGKQKTNQPIKKKQKQKNLRKQNKQKTPTQPKKNPQKGRSSTVVSGFHRQYMRRNTDDGC